jgi:DNA-directed RNA polymerase subunit RPC12/RpoP
MTPCVDCGGPVKKQGAIRCHACNGRFIGKQYGCENGKMNGAKRGPAVHRKHRRVKCRNAAAGMKVKALLKRLR